MNRELTVVLQQLILGRMIAALGTLHEGVPFVSMVPYAVASDGSFVLHVSRLAAHTQDMLDHPDVSLLITESEASGKTAAGAGARNGAGTGGNARRDSQKHIDARDVYLSRFPDAAPLFEFSDFNIVIIKPMSARVIAGFGQAITITGDDFSTTVGGRVKS